MRNDVHSPKNIIPEDYEFVVVRFREDHMMGFNGAEIFNEHRKITGGVFSNHEHGGSCMVCGAHMIDYAIFHHIPTNTYIQTGRDCAGHIESGHTDAFRRAAQIRRAAAKRNEKRDAAAKHLDGLGILEQVESMFHEGELGGPVVGYNVAYPPLAHYFDEMDLEKNAWAFDDMYADENYGSVDHMNWSAGQLLGHEVVKMAPQYMVKRAEGQFMTLVDLVRNLVKYGWSEKQDKFALSIAEKLRNFKDEVLEWNATYETLADAPEGKVTVTGTVLSEQMKDGYYGMQHKMLVQDDTGFKVWSTVPSKLSDVEKGDRVTFVATLTVSGNDKKFAFAKRPSKAAFVEGE